MLAKESREAIRCHCLWLACALLERRLGQPVGQLVAPLTSGHLGSLVCCSGSLVCGICCQFGGQELGNVCDFAAEF